MHIDYISQKAEVNQFFINKPIACAHQHTELPALHQAIESNDLETVKTILLTNPEQLYETTSNCDIWYTHLGNHTGDIDKLIATERGLLPLELAVQKGHLEIAQFLLEIGVNPNSERKEYTGTPKWILVDEPKNSKYVWGKMGMQ